MNRWDIVSRLIEIAELNGGKGVTEWRETMSQGGKMYAREIRKGAARETLLRLMRPDRGNRQDLKRAHEILRLAKWREIETEETTE